MNEGELPLQAAQREFEEEIGFRPEGKPIELGSFRQPGGKTIHAWAMEGDFDPARLQSNMFTLEWPPNSGRVKEFPEMDRAAWYSLPDAERKILKGQRPILHRLRDQLVLQRPGASSGAIC
jgi:predicted NUDIX family NTP pyrophosphohydrolase